MCSIHLIKHNDRAAIVDTGTLRSIPNLMAALERAQLTPADVEWSHSSASKVDIPPGFF